MSIFLKIISIQEWLNFLFTIVGVKVFSHFKVYKKEVYSLDRQLKNVDLMNLVNNLELMEKRFGQVVYLSLIPIIGFLPMIATIANIIISYKKIELIKELLSQAQKQASVEEICQFLPQELQTKLEFLELELHFFEEKGYHVVIAQDSYQILLNLIRDSIYKKTISKDSLLLVQKGFEKLESLYKAFHFALNNEEAVQQENHEQFVKNEFEKYDSVLSRIAEDVESKNSVFGEKP